MELQRLHEPAQKPKPQSAPKKSWIPSVPRSWDLRQLIGLSVPTHEPSYQALPKIPEEPVTSSSPLGAIRGEPTDEPEDDADANSEQTITITDHQALISSTSTSHNSFASAASVEDSVSSSTIASSHSTALSTPSTSTSICIAGELSQVIQIDKGVFASPKYKMDLHHLQAWKSIRSRLDDTLKHTFKPKPGLDPTLSLEFMMAGPSPSQLKPSIIIVCCHEPHKRQLKKIVKSQKWIAAYKYHCIILVDPLQKLFPSHHVNVDETFWEVEAAIPDGSPSLCGVLAYATATSGEGQAVISFTIGGVLAIDGKNYGITAGHTFQHSPHDLNSAASFTSDNAAGQDDDSDSEYDDQVSESPFVVFDDYSSSDDGSPVSSNQSLLETPVIAAGPLGGYAGPSRGQEFIPERKQVERMFVPQIHIGTIQLDFTSLRGGKMDWALIDLDEPERWASNTLPPTTNGSVSSVTSMVSSLATTGTLESAQVWVYGGVSGATRGWSSNCPVQLYIGADTDVSLEAQQIITDYPLAPGDSGAWAVQDDGTLCGHIIARRTGVVSLAYIVPISSILEEIKMYLHVANIALPDQSFKPKNQEDRGPGHAGNNNASNRQAIPSQAIVSYVPQTAKWFKTPVRASAPNLEEEYVEQEFVRFDPNVLTAWEAFYLLRLVYRRWKAKREESRRRSNLEAQPEELRSDTFAMQDLQHSRSAVSTVPLAGSSDMDPQDQHPEVLSRWFC